MNFYVIYAFDYAGKKVIDGFESEDREALYRLLEKNGYTPIKVFETPQYLKFIAPIFTPQAKTDDIIELLDNINIFLKAGIPVNDGLSDLEAEATSAHMKKIIRRLSNEVDAGNRLSYACKPFEKQFTTTIINLMVIGEETGKLSTTLQNGADFLRKTQELRNNTRKALMTPIISLTLIILAVSAWMVFVVPGMVDFFNDMEAELPPITVFIIATSNFITENGGFIFLMVIGSIFGFNIMYRSSEKLRIQTIKLILKLPIFSTLVSFFNIAFIMEYLNLSVNAGLTLYESLKLLEKSIANDLYRIDLQRVIAQLERGESYSSTLRDNPLYTSFATRVIEVGESSGNIANELKLVSETYYKKVDDLSLLIPKVVQPITMLIGGGFMALIMMGLMGPIYDLIANL